MLASNFDALPHPRRKEEGLPGNGGEFAQAGDDNRRGYPHAKGGGQGGGKKRRGGGGQRKGKADAGPAAGAVPHFHEASDGNDGAAFARALGVQDVDYRGANVFTVNNINRAVWELRRAGAEAVPGVRADADWFKHRFGQNASAVPALYDHQAGVIMVNPQGEFWSDPEAAQAFLRESAEQGFYSSSDLAHFIRHEYGHFLHHRQSPETYLAQVETPRWAADSESGIARQVSRYAAGDAGEFVAEVFAGFRAGKSYSPAVRNLYRRYGGPSL